MSARASLSDRITRALTAADHVLLHAPPETAAIEPAAARLRPEVVVITTERVDAHTLELCRTWRDTAGRPVPLILIVAPPCPRDARLDALLIGAMPASGP